MQPARSNVELPEKGSAAALSARRPSRWTSWFILFLLLLGFVAVLSRALQAGAETGQGLPPYSVYSDSNNGLGQAAKVLRKLGWQPVAITRPIHQTRYRGLLFVVEPHLTGMLGKPVPDLSEADARELLAWVARGNTLLLATRDRNALHGALGVTVERGDDDATPRRVDGIEVSGYTEDMARLSVEGQGSVTAAGDAVPLWWIGKQPGALLIPHGEGRVLVLADPSLFTHRGLLREDNVLLLSNVAALEAHDGRVLFDEYHHGIRSGGGYWGYLQYHNQHWALFQLLAVALTAGWAIGIRLGPPRPTPRASTADAVDYASAVARIYAQARASHLTALILVRDFFDGLTTLLHVRRASPPREILLAWRERWPDLATAERLRELLERAVELKRAAERRELLSDQYLLLWARAFDEFLNEARMRI